MALSNMAGPVWLFSATHSARLAELPDEQDCLCESIRTHTEGVGTPPWHLASSRMVLEHAENTNPKVSNTLVEGMQLSTVAGSMILKPVSSSRHNTRPNTRTLRTHALFATSTAPMTVSKPHVWISVWFAIVIPVVM